MIRYLHIVRDRHARERRFQRLCDFIVVLAICGSVLAACTCHDGCPVIGYEAASR